VPSTEIDGDSYDWEQTAVWGNTVVWGDGVLGTTDGSGVLTPNTVVWGNLVQ
jgi:hypothetical protein